MKRIFSTLFVFIAFTFVVSAQNVDTQSFGEPFEHYWSVGVGAGRVNEGLRAGWLEHLSLSKEQCGFSYVRMHSLFGDDMFTYFESSNGTVTYNWQYVDEVYDRMLSIGVRPFVELSFFPEAMAAKGTKMQMWYRNCVTPDPEKFSNWQELVRAFTAHVVERYGLEEVNNWYFEVWNEPNLTNGFFEGTRSQYFELYKLSAQAVKSVSPTLKVGGPATSNFIADKRHDGELYDHSKSRFYSQDKINKQEWKGIWIEQFLAFCEKEGLPVDFISCHPYPTDYALDPDTGRSKGAIRYVNSLYDDISWLRKTISSSAYPDAELHLTEWSNSPSSRESSHDFLPVATYIIKANLDCIGMANSLMYWTFTDVFEEKGGAPEVFHGGFGMINFQGIVKPSFHAYRFLHRLGDEKLYYQDPLFVSRHHDSGKISCLAFNYPDEYLETVPAGSEGGMFARATPKKLACTLTGLNPGAVFSVEILDKDHGNVYSKYKEIGSPHSLSIAQTSYLKNAAWETKKSTLTADSNGNLVLDFELEPWSCVFIDEL